ncbi:MAG: OmpA family protein [Flavobacteriaceae bacterium]
MKKTIFLILFTFCAGTVAQAQWHFETGVNDAKFSEFVNLSGTKTTLHSYNGLRDFSHAVGYFFPLKKLDRRIEDNGIPSVIRLGLGVGFDQMNLRTQADFNGYKIPVHYNMGQVQAQGIILLTQPIIKKQQSDATGKRRPAVFLNVEGGLTYNLYTNAVRTYAADKGYINDLRKDKEFVDAYPTYFFGVGLSFPINRDTELYGKYVVENAFSTSDNEVDDSEERFSTVKRRVMVGLRMDLRLKNKLKDLQEQRIAALEAREAQARDDSVDLSSLYAKIDALEAELKTHSRENIVTPPQPVVNEDTFTLQQHEQGFMYFPDFKHVLFPLNSSYFDHGIYDSQLRNLATFMVQNPNLTLKLVGYADSKTGTAETNLKLSKRRAKRVYDFLITQGISPYQMSYVGAGETLLFGIGDLTENRRTEIIIIKR